MAKAVSFAGVNRIFSAPPGRDDVSDLHTFVNGHAIVSAWELSAEELAEVNRTGRVFLSSLSGDTLFPVYLGSESEVRRLVADYGPVWTRSDDIRKTPCSNYLCANEGTHFPVIRFGCGDALEADALPYRVEVPQAICPECQPTFQPLTFFGDEARTAMASMIVNAGCSAPAFEHLVVDWVTVDDDAFADLVGGREARLWFG